MKIYISRHMEIFISLKSTWESTNWLKKKKKEKKNINLWLFMDFFFFFYLEDWKIP